MKTLAMGFAIFTLALTGCSRQTPQEDAAGKRTAEEAPLERALSTIVRQKQTLGSDYADLPSEAVLIKVGEHTLTKGELQRQIALRGHTIRLALPNQSSAINNFAVQNQMLAGIQDIFKIQSVLADYASEQGIRLTDADRSPFQEGFKRSCKQDFTPWGSFLKGFSETERQTISERVDAEAMMVKAQKEFIAQNPQAVSDEEVSDFLEKFARYQSVAMATNTLVWARGTNLWRRIKAGESFEKLANLHTEDDDNLTDGEWGAFRLSDLRGDGDLEKTVAALKIGDVSAPIEADNGLVILKLTDIENPTADGSAEELVKFPDTVYSLSRIFLKLPVIYDTLTHDEAVNVLKESREADAFEAFISNRIERTEVDYPSGVAIFETAKNITEMPLMVNQENAYTPKADGESLLKKDADAAQGD